MPASAAVMWLRRCEKKVSWWPPIFFATAGWLQYGVVQRVNESGRPEPGAWAVLYRRQDTAPRVETMCETQPAANAEATQRWNDAMNTGAARMSTELAEFLTVSAGVDICRRESLLQKSEAVDAVSGPKSTATAADEDCICVQALAADNVEAWLLLWREHGSGYVQMYDVTRGAFVDHTAADFQRALAVAESVVQRGLLCALERKPQRKRAPRVLYVYDAFSDEALPLLKRLRGIQARIRNHAHHATSILRVAPFQAASTPQDLAIHEQLFRAAFPGGEVVYRRNSCC